MSDEKRLSPSQRREARRLAEQQEQQEKSVRLRERVVNEPVPRVYSTPTDSGKAPRNRENPGSIMGLPVSICAETKADTEGNWSWGQSRKWSDDDWSNSIAPKLIQFQNLTWAEVHAQNTGGRERHKSHHDMDICDLVQEAFDRWIEIGLDEFDTTFRFRLQNQQRLWGVRIQAQFYVVWWDPEHRLYPVNIANN